VALVALSEFAGHNNYKSPVITLGIPDTHRARNRLEQFCKIDVKTLELIFSLILINT
jgi:hypothetical protein